MPVEEIDVRSLYEVSKLSVVRCADFAEAAAVCLDYHKHQQGILLDVYGDFETQFSLHWQKVTPLMRASRADMAYTVESGAYCLAMLAIEKITGLKVMRQSQKRTGFDYWLGSFDGLIVQDMARLEVSGILSGTTGKVNKRMREKIQQTGRSDHFNIPAFVVVVEFSQPTIKIIRR